MIAFALGRAATLVATLVVIAVASFFLLRAAPGGPFDEDRSVPPEIERALEAYYGLDRPVLEQLARWLAAAARGDLGPSFKYRGRSVNEILAAGAPASAAVGLLALEVAVLFGAGAGALAAARSGGLADRAVRALAALGMAMPNFLWALLFAALFCLGFKLLPIHGFGRPQHLVLPALSLAIPHASAIARLTRASLLETLEADFVRTARAKGLSETRVVLRHALRPAFAPVVQYLGPAAAGLVTGSLAVEAVFNVPGIGAHFVNAALNRDYTLVLGTVLFYSALLLVFNAACDLVAAWLDPRAKEVRSPGGRP